MADQEYILLANPYREPFERIPKYNVDEKCPKCGGYTDRGSLCVGWVKRVGWFRKRFEVVCERTEEHFHIRCFGRSGGSDDSYGCGWNGIRATMDA